MRSPARSDLILRGWRIPKDAVMLVFGYHAHMDPREWSHKDDHRSRSVNCFWAERFLTLKPDPTEADQMSPKNEWRTGQKRCPTLNGLKEGGNSLNTSEFPLKGCSGDWIRYGGDQRRCPGRHFARQEMLSTLAMMITLFDIQVIGNGGQIPGNDLGGIGVGALWPKDKMLVRIKRRNCV